MNRQTAQNNTKSVFCANDLLLIFFGSVYRGDKQPAYYAAVVKYCFNGVIGNYTRFYRDFNPIFRFIAFFQRNLQTASSDEIVQLCLTMKLNPSLSRRKADFNRAKRGFHHKVIYPVRKDGFN